MWRCHTSDHSNSHLENQQHQCKSNSGPTLAPFRSLLLLLDFTSHFPNPYSDNAILSTKVNCEIFQKGISAAEMVELGVSHLARTGSHQRWKASPLVKSGNRAQRATVPRQ